MMGVAHGAGSQHLARDRRQILWAWHCACKATCLSQRDSSCSSHVCHLVLALGKLLNVSEPRFPHH